jgi:trehalose 6-phosphate synthase/phosphatase
MIVSGRDKDTLDNWFSELNLNLVAEHGAWIREKNSSWKLSKGIDSNWKAEVKPILEQYVDRTPGAFIEEKDHSLAWHYRKADLKLGLVRALELKYSLTNYFSNLNLDVLEGSRVIEVRNAGINKGLGTMNFLNKNKWDYILAIGDDYTDEDMFGILPEHACSIKVGLKPSRAKYNLSSVGDINNLLKQLRSK